jgi:hypothetical protein
MTREIIKTNVFKMPLLLLTLFASIAFTRVALANSVPAIAFTPNLEFNNVESTYLGWNFYVNSPIWVTALGYWDYSEFSSNSTNPYCCYPLNVIPGLLDSHEVGIYSDSGQLLTLGTVPSGTAGTLVDDSFYVDVPAIELTPGGYTILGTQQGAGLQNPTDPVAFNFSSFNPIPEIKVTLGASGVFYTEGPHGVYTGVLPSQLSEIPGSGGPYSSLGYDAYIGPEFLASSTPPSSPSVTPEPSSFLLLGSGLAGLAGMIRRKLRA